MYTRVCRKRQNESERGENGFVYCTPHTHYVRAHALTQQHHNNVHTNVYTHMHVHTRARNRQV